MFNFILLLIVWVHSFSKMLLSVKFTEDKVFTFVILREKCYNNATLKSNPNFQSRLIRWIGVISSNGTVGHRCCLILSAVNLHGS